MNDWKLIFKVILGSVFLMLAVIFGLSRMSGTNTDFFANESLLEENASLIHGQGEAKVSVVIFSDMECSACKRAHELMGGLTSIDGVRVVFRNYPLSMHRYALITAKAVATAGLMGKGFEMIDLLFSKQEEWSGESKIEDRLVEYAKSLDLDEQVFTEKLNSSEVASIVSNDLSLGNSLRLSGTPTIFVNGEQIGADFVMAKVEELLSLN